MHESFHRQSPLPDPTGTPIAERPKASLVSKYIPDRFVLKMSLRCHPEAWSTAGAGSRFASSSCVYAANVMPLEHPLPFHWS
jgi:hypothetical protein